MNRYEKIKKTIIGSANTSYTHQTPLNGIAIDNQGENELTFNLGDGLTRKVPAKSARSYEFENTYTTVTVTATSYFEILLF